MVGLCCYRGDQEEGTYNLTCKRMCHIGIFLGVGVAFLLIASTQMSTALVQLSEMGDDQVTLNTVGAGSFIGQRVTELNSSPSATQDPNALPRSYFAFRGIPYAQATTRWKPPTPVEVRKAPRIATQFKPPCPQLKWDGDRRRVIGSQDCLYLSVFTPYVPSTVKRPTHGLSENTTSWTVENRNLLPVLVFIHGGEFLAGSVQLYGPDRFMKEDVVLVTVTYRLGLLGFLSNGEESLPGNYGLLDQIEALRWVQDNIYRFGGNPVSVCVFGNVEYLLLSNGAKGLFHSAIISPSSTSSVFSPQLKTNKNHSNRKDDAKKLFRMVAQEVGCGMSDEDQTLECLRLVETDSLIRVQHRLSKFFSYPRHPGGMSPGVDGSWSAFPVISDEPQNLLEQGKFMSSVPLMVGLSAFEGFNPFLEFYVKLGPDREAKLEDKDFLMDRLESTIKTILGLDPVYSLEFHRIFLSIWDFYFGQLIGPKWPPVDNVLWKLFRLFGDLTVNSGQRRLTQLLAANSKSPVFSYIFNASSDQFNTYLEKRLKSSAHYTNSSISNPERGMHSTEIPPWKELFYLFEPLDQPEIAATSGNPSTEVQLSSNPSKRNLTSEEESLSDFLVKLWVSFAKYKSPKQIMGNSRVREKWVRAHDGNLNYFILGVKSHPLKGDYRKAETGFWLSILPQIQGLSEQISELEPFPLLLWIFVGLTAVLVFISLILMICICCGGGSRGGRRGKAKF
ncbi:Neuroligin-1 [Folsomia candida]|uniref:Neuroligin-1 n=1 Tax=Folsomia candida TaxID=158441 RepID=A0A226EKJ3_FOLCA|nr:Neuroligin-1 [Folsomia candida]